MTVPSSSSGRCFIDTNIWLYALMLGQDQTKTTQAAVLIEREQEIVVSPQVINEVSVNLIKKAKFGEEEVRTIIADFYQSYHVLEFSEPILV